MSQVRLAVAGVGNCASSLVQGLEYYRRRGVDHPGEGLMHPDIGGYHPWDIEVVAAFDVDRRKVGLDVSEAIFARPNCTKTFQSDLPKTGTTVQMAPVLDGVAPHMADYPEDRRFVPADLPPVDVAAALQDAGADVLINYMPVGSEEATRFYAQAALDAGCAFVNCMPAFVVSDPVWARRFWKARLPCVGDDVKSQLGATITHRMLARLFTDRGVKIRHTYQLNTGGNTDFLNMLARDRLASKKISKTEAVQSQLDTPLPKDDVHIGPSDYVPWQNDNKVAFIRMEGELFGNVPMELEMRLSVEDSPNSAGVAIDAVRCCKLALDYGIAGPLFGVSAYLMKHPPIQTTDEFARESTEAFVRTPRLATMRERLHLKPGSRGFSYWRETAAGKLFSTLFEDETTDAQVARSK
ncbi:MAG: inositol-3-phosphate synthase [Methanobacteriota archaeon]